MKRNYAIEFYRYLLMFVVFVLHFRWYGNFAGENGQFNGGYLAVEFFFVVSGFFLAQRAERVRLHGEQNAHRATWQYMKERCARILPAYWLSLALFVLAQAICQSGGDIGAVFSTAGRMLREGYSDILLTQIFWRPAALDYYTWYISALLWGSAIVYYLLARWRKAFLWMIAPAILLFGAHHFGSWVGNVDISAGWEGLLRGVMGLSMGCIVHEAFRALEPRRESISVAGATALEIVLLGAILAVMYWIRCEWWDCLMLIPIAMLVLLTMLNRGRLTRLLNRECFGKLGAISLLIYLNQNTVMTVGAKLFPSMPFWPFTIVLFVILTLLAALIHRMLNQKRA